MPVIKFIDVEDLDEAKADLQEIVYYLHRTQLVTCLGNCSNGVLLVGLSGAGKTSLARAVAGEGRVFLFWLGGGDYKNPSPEMMKKVFAAAKKKSASVIILDDIHDLSRNQKLTEVVLREFEGRKETNLIVIGATSRPELVDQSLLEQGRFDRIVSIPYPDIDPLDVRIDPRTRLNWW